MEVEVRIFAGLRARAGKPSVAVDVADGATVADVLDQLQWLTAGTPVVIAVNREYATSETPLGTNDELALIAPVSGGAATTASPAHVRVSSEPLSIDHVATLVSDSRAGAVVTFMGMTRDVPALDYEAYFEMAEKTLLSIAQTAIQRHGLCAAAVEHRIGQVALSEPSVIVAASAPHREAAFAGARELIDEVKTRAPIWKREQGVWVAGELPSAESALPAS
jgi:molybdopterin synthase catalytic subunit